MNDLPESIVNAKSRASTSKHAVRTSLLILLVMLAVPACRNEVASPGSPAAESTTTADAAVTNAPEHQSFQGTITAIDADNASLCDIEFESVVALDIGATVRGYRGPKFLGYVTIVARREDILVGRALGFLPPRRRPTCPLRTGSPTALTRLETRRMALHDSENTIGAGF